MTAKEELGYFRLRTASADKPPSPTMTAWRMGRSYRAPSHLD